MEGCYSYPIDLISMVVISVILNGVLAISLVRRIAEHNKDLETLRKIMIIMKKGGWTI